MPNKQGTNSSGNSYTSRDGGANYSYQNQNGKILKIILESFSLLQNFSVNLSFLKKGITHKLCITNIVNSFLKAKNAKIFVPY